MIIAWWGASGSFIWTSTPGSSVNHVGLAVAVHQGNAKIADLGHAAGEGGAIRCFHRCGRWRANYPRAAPAISRRVGVGQAERNLLPI